jgi:pimeloyl-ACP methyl ester carboxylesterase
MSSAIENRMPEPLIGDSRAFGPRAAVVALHCSGADSGQWRKLAGAIEPEFKVLAPSFIGSLEIGHWCGDSAFTLMHEAEAIIEIVDLADRPVHLVGHSYGGGVALKVASLRADRIASLTLYEPSAFHMLRQLGSRAEAELTEIEDIAKAVSAGVVSGAYQWAAAAFVDYWADQGAWAALRPASRDGLLRWLPKAPLDFGALLDEDTPLASYERISCPVLVMRGEHARAPSRLIAETLARRLPVATLEVLQGAGHMGPSTHASCVIGRITEHIMSAATCCRPNENGARTA